MTVILCKTLKKKGCAFWNIGKIYTVSLHCWISIAFYRIWFFIFCWLDPLLQDPVLLLCYGSPCDAKFIVSHFPLSPVRVLSSFNAFLDLWPTSPVRHERTMTTVMMIMMMIIKYCKNLLVQFWSTHLLQGPGWVGKSHPSYFPIVCVCFFNAVVDSARQMLTTSLSSIFVFGMFAPKILESLLFRDALWARCHSDLGFPVFWVTPCPNP